MKLTVTKEASKKLSPYLTDSKYDLLLDFDDGVGSLSKVGVCSLDSNFRVVAVKHGDYAKDYNEVLESNVGPFRYKDYSDMYMDKVMRLELNPNNQMLRLIGNGSGELTASVALLDMSTQA
ncbi:iron-sulfur cluster biosynthesis family protein [Ligilactobacillus equi]|uniref:iron-sulfur cluster biosynthesis family protein n=1 Tax=Ligilactobacillus equi TaxID=137357 RepID=UPI002ED08113